MRLPRFKRLSMSGQPLRYALAILFVLQFVFRNACTACAQVPSSASIGAALAGVDIICSVRRDSTGSWLILFLHDTDDTHLSHEIGCYDRMQGRIVWRQPSCEVGPQPCIQTGTDEFVEAAGFPRQSWVVVRRYSDGRIIGRQWDAGACYVFGVSKRRVLVGGLDELRLYNCLGRLLRRIKRSSVMYVHSLANGFAADFADRTLILDSSGRIVATVRAQSRRSRAPAARNSKRSRRSGN